MNKDDDEVMEITPQGPKSRTIFGRDKNEYLSFCINRQEVQGLTNPVGEEVMYFKHGMQPTLFTTETTTALYFQLQFP